MQLEGFLIVVSGPSGAGKNTLITGVFPRFSSLEYSVSVTTREAREGEVEGVDYFFRTEEEFDAMVANGELLEWAEFCGSLYGTPKSFVEERMSAGKTVIMDVDIVGARHIREAMPDAVLVFLLPPSFEDLKQRLTRRGKDSKEVIEDRLRKSFEEIKHIVDYDYFIVNDKIEHAVERLATIIQAEWCRVKRANPREIRSLFACSGKGLKG